MSQRVSGFICLALCFGAPLAAHAQQTFSACYVPSVGAVYMIKLPGLPTSCLAPLHQEITWREGATGPAGGDLSGAFPNPTVSGLRGRSVSANVPAAGQVLSFNGTSWTPVTPSSGGEAGGDLSGVYPNPSVAKLLGRSLATTSPTNGQVLQWDASALSWKASTPPSGVSVHAQLAGLAADDHPQYLLANGGRTVAGNLSAGGNKITALGAATIAGDAVRFEQALKLSDPAAGDLSGSYPNPSEARLQGRAVSSTAPTNGQTLVFDVSTNSWRPSTPTTGVSVHAQLTGLNADDHQQYLLANGTRPLSGNLSAGGNKVTGLAAGASAGDAVRFEQAVKSGDVAGGDLAGTLPAPTVARIQGIPVTAAMPNAGQVLTYGAGGWAPAAPKSLSIVEVVRTVAVNTNSNPPHTEQIVMCPSGMVAISAASFPGAPPAFPRADQREDPYVFASARLANGAGWQFAWVGNGGNNGDPGTAVVYCAAP